MHERNNPIKDDDDDKNNEEWRHACITSIMSGPTSKLHVLSSKLIRLPHYPTQSRTVLLPINELAKSHIPAKRSCIVVTTPSTEIAVAVAVTVVTAAGFLAIQRGEDATGAVRDALEASVIPAEGKLDPIADPVFGPDAAPIAATQVGAGRVLLRSLPIANLLSKINSKTPEVAMPTEHIKHPSETGTQPKALHGMFFRPAPVADMDVVVGMPSLESLHG
ncbi:hypothetical protein M422DRAFT_254625 [Sphaerobolus stellatus SS14]|uniref:Uncharacterized protein n=1 Tax=Sphaerobolus stellatus (strain SS14) TaxID=990650 RepID=A0A0C9VVA1_SPHS4|nr:hypothetical protein M422DRAFT_254625 [Sphaerobolus stellatus SS14]